MYFPPIFFSSYSLLLLVFGAHVIETLYTSFELSVGV
jgi:hypothetical protein